GGSASSAIPGVVRRCGPAHCTGDARPLHMGSVRTLSAPTWSNTVEWPIHVAESVPVAARGRTKPGWTWAGSIGRPRGVDRRVRVHVITSRNVGGFASGHGFRKWPSDDRWLDSSDVTSRGS